MNQKLNNTCIKCESVEHGKEIVKFYGDNGFQTNGFLGSDIGYFYGVFATMFGSYEESTKMKLLTLQEAKELLKENQYPKVMWVSDKVDFKGAVKRVVFSKKCNHFIAWTSGETLEEAENEINTFNWKYAKDIEDETEFQTKTRERIAAIEKEWEELKKLVK